MAYYTYDGLLASHLGLLGPFQIFLAIIASIDQITSGWNIMVAVFIASTPEHICSLSPVPYNCTQEEWQTWGIPHTCTKEQICTPDACKVYQTNVTGFVNCSHGGEPGWSEELQTESCSSWTYRESFYSESVVKEWDLVCDKKGLGMTISGSFLFGRCVGPVIVGILSDKFGRRRTMLFSTFLTFVAALSSAFSTNIYMFLALRFVQSVCDMGRGCVGFTLGMEFFHPARRVFFIGVWGVAWVIGYVSLAGIAYFIQNWRILLIVIALPEVIFFIAYIFLLPESPRWLMLHQKKEELSVVIRRFAKFNKKHLPEDMVLEHEKADKNKASVVDLVRSPRLFLLTAVLAYIFFANSFVFYGLSLNSSNLAGDEYLNFFISGAIELPAYILIATLYERLPRRPPFSFCLVVGGLLLLVSIGIPSAHSWVVVVLTTVSKFLISASFMITWLLTSEVFPTAVRGLATGIANGMARSLALTSAYVELLEAVHPVLPSVVFSLAAILAGLLVIVLPETQGTVLTQTVEESEENLKGNLCRMSCHERRNPKKENPDVIKGLTAEQSL